MSYYTLGSNPEFEKLLKERDLLCTQLGELSAERENCINPAIEPSSRVVSRISQLFPSPSDWRFSIPDTIRAKVGRATLIPLSNVRVQRSTVFWDLVVRAIVFKVRSERNFSHHT
jgi:hypothetical protein